MTTDRTEFLGTGECSGLRLSSDEQHLWHTATDTTVGNLWTFHNPRDGCHDSGSIRGAAIRDSYYVDGHWDTSRLRKKATSVLGRASQEFFAAC